MKISQNQHPHHATAELKHLVHYTAIAYNLVQYIFVKQQHQKLQLTTPTTSV